jgi:CRISPR-associated protein Cas5t
MNTFWLKIHAPFAAFRGFQAGVYRSTAPVMPPSAAYGLVLNLAGIEMRDPLPNFTTLILQDIPKLQIAVGVISQPKQSSLYQQLHSYPVGDSGKPKKAYTQAEKDKSLESLAKGAKFWITPVRREILIDYIGIIGVKSDEEKFTQTYGEPLLALITKGLRGELDEPRYGLPFAGDNNLLFDRIDIIEKPCPKTRWYTRMMPDDAPRKGSCRLTVGIDRADNSKTSSPLFAPSDKSSVPPEHAWTWTPHE